MRFFKWFRRIGYAHPEFKLNEPTEEEKEKMYENEFKAIFELTSAIGRLHMTLEKIYGEATAKAVTKTLLDSLVKREKD